MSPLSTVMQALCLLLALAVSALGKPLTFRPRDAISPPITNPTASSVWKAGDQQTVTWDLSGLNGAQPSNPIGKVLLGTFINGEEHLMIESPLASGFNILDGNVTLTVPTVTTGSDYIVCLFGSSGDISAPFTIVGTDASASASASTHVNAASSSNTLPPHETTDPSTTTVSLPHGVPVTGDPSSAPTTTTADASATGTSSTTALVSIPSGVVPPSGTPAASSTATAPAASSAATGSSTGTGTATAAASSGTGNSGARMAVANVPLWSAAVSGALALFALL